jgi:hypothetical protein
MRTILAAIIIALCVSVMAHAQEDRPEDRVQARGLVGGSAFFESQTHKAVGGTVDFRLADGLRLGPEVIYHIGPGQDRDITSTALVSYEFRRLKRVTPFVTGGVGLLHHTEGRGWSSNSLTAGGGGGLKIAITRRLFVVGEGRAGWEPIAQAMVGIGYRF